MPYKFIDIKKRLNKLGFEVKRQRGSHVIFSDGKMILPVPKHSNKDISVGVENKILAILKINKEEFKKLV